MKTKGGSGPSGMDAEGWRRILTSRSFGDSSTDLCTALANMTKRICTVEENSTSLESFLACRLIPLDKNPGLRPIGIGEVLRRIAGKVVMSVVREDVMTSVGSLQVCAGHQAGCEALIHAMRTIFEEESADGVILVDATNAFNSVNRKAFLHNILIICPSLATFVRNCYSLKSRLFIPGGGELTSNEGTTQGDPVAMAIYAIAIIPLLLILVEFSLSNNHSTKNAGYADDVTAAGKLSDLKSWWEKLCEIGPKFGYYPNATKTWLITSDELFKKATNMFEGTNIQITTDGQRHLGAVIGKEQYKDQYMTEKVDEWIKQLRVLSAIAQIEPQAAYCGFVTGFKQKMAYSMRTIPKINNHLKRLDEVITTEFIPALTGGVNCSEDLRKLMSLPPSMGGLSIPVFAEQASVEFRNSIIMTEHLSGKIVNQVVQLEVTDSKQQRNRIKAEKRKQQSLLLEQLRCNMDDVQKRLNDLATEKGASSWLTTLPIKEEGYLLNKQLFWDLIRIRYGLQLARLPSKCECGCVFDLQHALSCKKGGFVSLRHNELRNLTAKLLKEVCKDVATEPLLTPLTGESLKGKTAITGNEARLDVCARGFWQAGQIALFDVRVFNPIAKRFANQNLQKAYETNEKEKKRAYNERVIEIEHGSFTPLVFAATGGMGRECQKFFSRLAEIISEKRQTKSGETMGWIRRKISFSLCRSVGICIRGSRTVFQNNKNSEQSLNSNIQDSEMFARMMA